MRIISLIGLLMAVAASAAAVRAAEPATGAASKPDGVVPATILFAPPEVSSEQALLACDRLAEALSQRNLRVIDRSQVERILRERRLDPAPGPPVLAYDLVLRVRFSGGDPGRETRLELLDLSTGNVVGERAFPQAQADDPSQLNAMAAFCEEVSREAVATPREGLLTVRLLGVVNADRLARLDPYCRRLDAALEQTVGRCPQARIVRHLEAMTSKEESLFLLMGLSRLPGGREFTPQADVTVETELVEAESEGRTFDDTVLELRLRVTGRGGAEAAWEPHRATVARWPGLVVSACGHVGRQVGAAQPAGAAADADEMARRRRQAEAEVAAAMREKGKYVFPDPQRLATAAKLDPTNEEAAFWLLGSAMFHPRSTPEMQPRVPAEALSYLERFQSTSKRRKRASYLAVAAVENRSLEPQQVPILRRIVEINLSGRIGQYENITSRVIVRVLAGMKDAGAPWDERKQWLTWAVERVDVLEKDIEKVGTLYRSNVLYGLLMTRALAVSAAAEAGDADMAKPLVEGLMTRNQLMAWCSMSYHVIGVTRKAVAALNDAALSERFETWAKPLTTPVHHLSIKWPDPPVYGDLAATDVPATRFRSALPLVIAEGKLFVATGQGGASREVLTGRVTRSSTDHGLEYIPLDKRGAPVSGIMPLPAPPGGGKTVVSGAAFAAGRLVVSTRNKGVLAYHVAAKRWKHYDSEAGLPHLSVYSVLALGGPEVLCAGGEVGMWRYMYKLNVDAGTVTVIHRAEGRRKRGDIPVGRYEYLWRNGDVVMAACNSGLITDVLGPKPAFRRGWPGMSSHGWRPISNSVRAMPASVVVCRGRRWVGGNAGLHETNDSGKVLRAWSNRLHFVPYGTRSSGLVTACLDTASDFPGDRRSREYDFLVGTQTHLFLIGHGGQVLCYDPQKDLWYGPLPLIRAAYGLSGRSGAWLCGEKELVYLEPEPFIAEAKRAGRVMSTDDVRRRKLELAEAAAPLEAVKYLILMHDLDAARERLEAYLAAHPQDADAMYLMVVLHDAWCLNQPDEALEWCEKLAAHDDPDAACTGYYERFRIRRGQRQWDEAVRAGEALLERFPNLNHMESEVARYIANARRALAREQAQAADAAKDE